MTETSLADLDRRIEALGATLERTRANLVELDLDVTRQTLAASTSLTGATAQQWQIVSGNLLELWAGQLALDDLIDRLTRARSAKGVANRVLVGKLLAILDGESVTLAQPDVAAGPRPLTAGPAPTETRTVDEVLTAMSEHYAAAATLVAAIAEAWGSSLPALEALHRELDDLEATAERAGARRPNELPSTRRALADAIDTARTDPLSLPSDALVNLRATVERSVSALRAALGAKQKLEEELAVAAKGFEECERATRRANEGLERAATRVTLPDDARRAAQQLATEVAEVRAELVHLSNGVPGQSGTRTRVVQLVQRAARLQHEADELERLPATLLALRDELRGRLEAYRAKAMAVGAAEDLDLDGLYMSARDILYSAPCALLEAEDRVAAYQAAIRVAPKEAR